MKKYQTVCCLFFLSFCYISTFAQEKYVYNVDLLNVKNDEVFIELITPAIKEDKVIYSFPKAVPGSYSNKDFGRFISSFSAYDANGKKLKTKKINDNQFAINNAGNLKKITYWVEDTWDHRYNNFVFQPGGTNIDAEKNFVINNHAFFGYFEGYKMLPIELQVSKPASMFGATHLQATRSNDRDVLFAPNYVYLADNPIIYAKPDTTSFIAGNATINVAVYSAMGVVTSQQIAGYLKPMSVALQKFFKGNLPVDSYQFLFYFENPADAIAGQGMGGYGALEHNYSSLYFLPEISLESRLKSLVDEVTSHEFLHILTPLNLHSEEIENFDYIDPKMSKHLWLYEGVTEYFAHLVQLQGGIITEEQFLKNMRQKMDRAKDLWGFSMTEMSKNVLTEEYKSKYDCVYSRGALIAWMLDLYIRNKTSNEKTLKSVIQELAKMYGPSKPFTDDTFFDDFIKASHPEVKQFIDKYIEGKEELKFDNFMSTFGYSLIDSKTIKVYYHGERLGLRFNEQNRQFAFTDVSENALGIKNNDVLLSVNGEKITPEALNEAWDKYFDNNTAFPQLTMTVLRNGKEKELSGPLYVGSKKIRDTIFPSEEPSAEQRKNRFAFLSN